MKPRILVFGSGGHACSIIDAIESQGKYEIFGLVDSFRNKGEHVHGCSVLGSEVDLPLIYRSHNLQGIVIAIGDNFARSEMHSKLLSVLPEAVFPVVVHRSAVISPYAHLHQGAVIMAGSIVNSKAEIGEFCIVNTGSVIEHECILGSCVSVGPNACLGGRAIVLDRSAVMLGTSVAHGIEIGHDSIVGAGSVIIRNVPSNVVVVGAPGKILRNRQKGDRYL